jgi:hypothetical protein
MAFRAASEPSENVGVWVWGRGDVGTWGRVGVRTRLRMVELVNSDRAEI